MYEDIINNQAQDRVLVTSFYKEQNVRFREISKGQVAIGASQKEVLEGFIKFNLGLGNKYQPIRYISNADPIQRYSINL